MKDLLIRLDAWVNGPNVGPSSDNLGASETDLQQAEQALGVGLPADLRLAFMLHNPLPLPTLDENLSLHDVVRVWQHYCGEWSEDAHGRTSAPSGPIKPDWWNPRWIPITFNQGNGCFVDLDPAAGGHLGQVASYDIDGPQTALVAPSFRAWIEGLLADFALVQCFLADPESRNRLGQLTQADLDPERFANVANVSMRLSEFQRIAARHDAGESDAIRECWPGFLALFRTFLGLLANGGRP